MRGIGENGNDFEGKSDGGIGVIGLDIPKRCEGCPYVEGVTREHAADVGLGETEAAQREKWGMSCCWIRTKTICLRRACRAS